jgi:gas vesicle protein
MTNGYERFDDERHGGGFVLGLLTGTVLGAGLGLLFAPKAGSELRNQISGQAEHLAKNATEGYQRASDTAGEWASQGREKGREFYDKARDAVAKTKDAVARGTDEAERYVRDAADAAGTVRRG